MKTKITLIFILWGVICAYGQVETHFFPKRDAFAKLDLFKDHSKSNKRTVLPSFDAQKLIDEDKLNKGIDKPFRFGKGFDLKITLDDGGWCSLDEGRLWSMEFQSLGAYSINFVFDKFFLSDNAKLYIANANGTMLYGPVTSKQNTKNGFFLTDLISGDDVTIYLYEPNSEKGKSKLSVKTVVHAYKNLFSNMAYGNLGGSGSCNNDIACFPAWDDESDAVALVLLSNGTELCSGSLLMAANQSFRPYFLSAFHCIDSSKDGSLSATEISDAQNWMFKFQYKMTSCGGSSATTGITYNGAAYRAAWNASDFSLMEMNNSPLGDSQFTWLGWDRSGNSPTSGTGIHHPSGDVMKISFDNDAIIETSEGSTSTGTSHWYVDIDNGTLEHGSSGSPLFNENRRVVGQLHSGYPGCSSSKQFWYGCFHRSWTGGSTNTTRLSNWLDPCGSGTMTTNTTRSPYLSGSSIVCSSGAQFTVENPSGATVSWTCSTNISFDHQTGNPKTFTANGTGTGTIQAILISGCGNVTLPQKDVWVGTQQPGTISIAMDAPIHRFTATVDGLSTATSYNWYLNGVMNSTYHGSSAIFNRVSPYCGGMYQVQVEAINPCGTSARTSQWVYEPSCLYAMALSPNPTGTESTIALSNENEAIVVADKEWVLEIYGSDQLLKMKETKLKGKEYKINTSGWKDGVYIVRVKIDDQIISEKLVVKH